MSMREFSTFRHLLPRSSIDTGNANTWQSGSRLPCLACREFSTFLHVPERRSSINTGNAKERGEMFGGCSALPCPFSGQDKSSWLRGLTLVCTEFRLPPLHRGKQWTWPEEKIMKMYFVNFMIPSCGLFLKLIIFAQVFSMKLLPSEELDR